MPANLLLKPDDKRQQALVRELESLQKGYIFRKMIRGRETFASNIQHSLAIADDGRCFGKLRELYDAGELTNAVWHT